MGNNSVQENQLPLRKQYHKSPEADVRGTMAIDQNVPVGFQAIRCKVRLGAKDGTKPKLLTKLQEAAERCCVVQQTLRSPPSIDTTFEIL
ncbi:MAG: putative OsmC-like protein [Desulforhopalus sp.]|jgi:uncharacterized OsmC-like protein